MKSWMFLTAMLLSGAAQGQTVVKHDREFYSKGKYVAYAAPWAAYGTLLRQGIDYVNVITISPAQFPARTRINWRWPIKPSSSAGVYGYNAISHGNYDGGTPQEWVPPAQVDSIVSSFQSFSWAYWRGAGDFNLLTECFLTSQAGVSNSKVAEIGFLLHTPHATRTWVRTGVQLGQWTDSKGRTWAVSRNTGPNVPFYIFMPPNGADVMRGTVDLRGALTFLKSKGSITGKEWVNGVAFGAEPLSGSGGLTVFSWAPYQSAR